MAICLSICHLLKADECTCTFAKWNEFRNSILSYFKLKTNKIDPVLNNFLSVSIPFHFRYTPLWCLTVFPVTHHHYTTTTGISSSDSSSSMKFTIITSVVRQRTNSTKLISRILVVHEVNGGNKRNKNWRLVGKSRQKVRTKFSVS